MTRSILLIVVGIGSPYSGESSADSSRPCSSISATLPVGAEAAPLAGTYHLTIIGTSGKATGLSAEGTLRLWAPPDSFRRAPNPRLTFPLIGTSTLDVTRVGGIEDGGLTSERPEVPGIRVWEFHADRDSMPFTEITLHLGADGNRRDVARRDGAYNALYVDQIAPSGFRGRWHASLGYTSYKADGYFCAERA